MTIRISKGLRDGLDAKLERALRGRRSFENWKLYRWWVGGLWVLLTDEPRWLRARWLGDAGEYLYAEGGLGFHRTHISVIAIEDYGR